MGACLGMHGRKMFPVKSHGWTKCGRGKCLWESLQRQAPPLFEPLPVNGLPSPPSRWGSSSKKAACLECQAPEEEEKVMGLRLAICSSSSWAPAAAGYGNEGRGGKAWLQATGHTTMNWAQKCHVNDCCFAVLLSCKCWGCHLPACVQARHVFCLTCLTRCSSAASSTPGRDSSAHPAPFSSSQKWMDEIGV